MHLQQREWDHLQGNREITNLILYKSIHHKNLRKIRNFQNPMRFGVDFINRLELLALLIKQHIHKGKMHTLKKNSRLCKIPQNLIKNSLTSTTFIQCPHLLTPIKSLIEVLMMSQSPNSQWDSKQQPKSNILVKIHWMIPHQDHMRIILLCSHRNPTLQHPMLIEWNSLAGRRENNASMILPSM